MNQEILATDQEIDACQFGLDPQYVRCGLYVTVAFGALGFVAIWISRAVPGSPPGAENVSIMLWFLAAAGLLPLRWRLAVDAKGIWRRRVWTWELWSWEDFGSERLKFGYMDRSFVDPVRPIWRRTLFLGYLTEVDSDRVCGWIDLMWRPAPLPPMPAVLELRVGEFRKRPLRLDSQEIRLGSGARQNRYLWTEVVSLEITRLRHEHSDFHELRLVLPTAKVHLRRQRQHGLETWNWSGAAPELVANFCLNHVSQERRLIIASIGPPTTAEERDSRLAKARLRVRDARNAGIFMATLVLAAMSWFAVSGEWRMLIMLGVACIIYGSVFAYLYRDAQRKYLEIAQGTIKDRPATTIE